MKMNKIKTMSSSLEKKAERERFKKVKVKFYQGKLTLEDAQSYHLDQVEELKRILKQPVSRLQVLISSSDLRPALLDHVNYKTAVAVLYNRWDEMKDVRTVIALLNQERWPDVSERLRKRLGTGDPQEIKRIWKNQMTLVSYCLRTDQVQELLKSQAEIEAFLVQEIITKKQYQLITNLSILRQVAEAMPNHTRLLNYTRLQTEENLQAAIEFFGKGYTLRFPVNLDDFKHKLSIAKNEKLIVQLRESRESMCGIGTRRLKQLLNQLEKSGDDIALIYRLVLELQEVNIQAKETYGMRRRKKYDQKETLLRQLIEICKKKDYTYGYQDCHGVQEVSRILYFELPGIRQISFHCSILDSSIPRYEKDWNGVHCQTLPALEQAISTQYAKEIYEVQQRLL